MHYLQTLNPVLAALLAGLFTWGLTALGAALVFPFRSIDQRIYSLMLGFSAGVMVAASFWSLLAPAIVMSEGLGPFSFVPALLGFLLGGVSLAVIDRCTGHYDPCLDPEQQEQKSLRLLMLAITIHNIPEGLAVGVAFGAAAGGDIHALVAAILLAVGIGIQNFPEGAAVSMPLYASGLSRRKSFFYGQLSAIVEPICCVIGALLVTIMSGILPYALAFAAGAMIFVVAQELIPRSQTAKTSAFASAGTMLGFAIMMVLDVALG